MFPKNNSFFFLQKDLAYKMARIFYRWKKLDEKESEDSNSEGDEVGVAVPVKKRTVGRPKKNQNKSKASKKAVPALQGF